MQHGKKRWLALVLACLLGCAMQGMGFALEPDDVTAKTAVLVDAETGQVLFDKGMHVQREPASITKVMTALLTVEQGGLNDTVTVSETAVDIPYSSNMALTSGEEVSVNDALYGLMLPSANDAANALAEHVAGDQAAFAGMMNARAKELGAKSTTFVNPSGLPEDGHLTTAYDMAMITLAAVRNDDFLRYFGTARYTVPPTNKQPEERPLTNQMFMLLPDQEWCYNPDVIGGKVGYTDAAQHTMTSAAQRDGRTLVAVVMGCGKDQKFYDTQMLFDYGFDEFTEVAVPTELLTASTVVPVVRDGETVGEATFTAQETTMLLPNGVAPTAIEAGYSLPETVEYDSEPEASMMLTIAVAPELRLELPLTPELALEPSVASMLSGGWQGEEESGFPVWALVLLAVPLLMVVWLIWKHYQIRRRAARRRARQQRVLEERRNRLEEYYRRSSS